MTPIEVVVVVSSRTELDDDVVVGDDVTSFSAPDVVEINKVVVVAVRRVFVAVPSLAVAVVYCERPHAVMLAGTVHVCA